MAPAPQSGEQTALFLSAPLPRSALTHPESTWLQGTLSPLPLVSAPPLKQPCFQVKTHRALSPGSDPPNKQRMLVCVLVCFEASEERGKWVISGTPRVVAEGCVVALVVAVVPSSRGLFGKVTLGGP